MRCCCDVSEEYLGPLIRCFLNGKGYRTDHRPVVFSDMFLYNCIVERADDASLDQLDYRLILEMQDDPRRSFRKLAQRLAVSESTVRRRLGALISSGTLAISAHADPLKVGYQTIAFIGLHVHPSSIEATSRRLVELPNIRYACTCSGSFDFLIWGYFGSAAKLADFIGDVLGQIPGVVQAETMMQLRLLKNYPGASRLDAAHSGLVPLLEINRRTRASPQETVQKTRANGAVKSQAPRGKGRLQQPSTEQSPTAVSQKTKAVSIRTSKRSPRLSPPVAAE